MSEKKKWYRCDCGWEGDWVDDNKSFGINDGWVGCPKCGGLFNDKIFNVSDEIIKVWRVSLYVNDTMQSGYIEENIDNIVNGIVGEMTADSDDSYMIACLEMNLSEYHKLPEADELFSRNMWNLRGQI